MGDSAQLTIAVSRRFNLGNFEHVEGKIEIALPPCQEDQVWARVDAVQKQILQFLTLERLTVQATSPPPATTQPAPAAAPAAPVVKPAGEADLKEIRKRIIAAVSEDGEKQQVVLRMLAEAGLSQLKQASHELLLKIAEEIGA